MRQRLILVALSVGILAACDTATAPDNPEPGTVVAPTANQESTDSQPSATADMTAPDTTTPATTVAPSTTVPNSTTTSAEGTSGPADGEFDISAADAGRVLFTVGGATLTLDDIIPSDGWTHRIDEEKPDEIEIDFTDNTVEVELEIEIESWGLEVDLEIEQPATDGTFTFDVWEAGTVTIEVNQARVSFVSIDLGPDWAYVVDETDGEVDIDITHTSENIRIEFEAEVDDGDLEVEVDTDFRN